MSGNKANLVFIPLEFYLINNSFNTFEEAPNNEC